MELLGTVYSLNRTDVPSILELTGYDNLSLVEELILGDWTPEPPQCLRRFSFNILRSVDEAGGGGEGGLSERYIFVGGGSGGCAREICGEGCGVGG